MKHGDPQHEFPANRLIHETSPYLLQHAHNPVQWYPWGPEAFAKAKREDKPIFLSVGYSTCYWCHVMEKECFEREDVAEILNAHFVSIKVDREERPDVDKQYMLATQLMTGSGGWPNSVWLTPDGRPWMAGTYFPRRSFIPLLHSLKDAWADRRPEVEKQADRLTQAIRQASAGPEARPGPLEQSIIDRGVQQILSAYDPEHGGFQGSPKFPPHGGLALVIDQYRRTKNPALLPMITRTLDGMYAGGVHDHIGGGFHRYSVDDRWFLPHFEKMLYDNAQLMRAYTDGFELTKEARYRDAAEGIYRWLAREMVDDGGGFYSAMDAGEVGEEGEFYTWDEKEVRMLLGEPAGKRFCDAYGFDPAGNWTEQASGEKPGTNIPVRPIGSADNDGLRASRAKLLKARNRRTHPHTDDKVLAGWNGLMIGALARAGEVFDDPRYTKSAVAAAEFIHQNMTEPEGKLLRSYRANEARQPAYLDDYAYLAVGLLDLYDTTNDKKWLGRAQGLADSLLRDFQDETAGGFYFSTQDHDDILLRSKNLQAGGNVPSANGMAALALLRLGRLTGQDRYTQAGQRTLDSMYVQMVHQPTSAEAALLALALWLDRDPAAAKLVKTRTPNARESHRPVTVELFASATNVKPGQMIDLTIELDIADPWHIYATSPDAKFLLPTRVTIDGGQFIQAGRLHAPKSISKTDTVLKATIESYTGRIVFRTALAASKTAPKGPAPVTITVQYQPCNDKHCLPPETVRLVLPITIE